MSAIEPTVTPAERGEDEAHDPCPHSLQVQLCCTCAGCVNSVWDCGETRRRPSWVMYQLERLYGQTYRTHGLVVVTLVIVFLLASGLLTNFVWLVYLCTVLSIAVLLYGVTEMITALT